MYLGGGTPSLLDVGELSRLIDRLRIRFRISAAAEITLEANPEDVSPERRDAWRAAGVNRISVGIQSFEDRELAAVGRRHDAAGAERALRVLSDGGAGADLSGDLILGLPEQTEEGFRRSLARLCDSGVGHLSIYLLETEKSKAIEEDRRGRPDRYLSDDAQAALWLEASEILSRRGYEHYEISNWALAGRQARHNVKYWRRTPTLGLGVSAHELWDGRRRANVSAIPAYIERLEKGERPVASTAPSRRRRERPSGSSSGCVFPTAFRRTRSNGGSRSAGDSLLAEDYAAWRERGLLRTEADRVAFTERGYLLSNEILCRFV